MKNCIASQHIVGSVSHLTGGKHMFIGGPIRPLSDLEDLELRRDRLQELITLQLVSPTLLEQLKRAVAELNHRILVMQNVPQRIAA